MAKQKNNVVTHGLSGTVGDLLVFRQTAAGTVVAKRPRVNNKVSDAQKEQRRRFQRAVIYSRAALTDPAMREGYEAVASHRQSQTPYNVAVADFLHAPDIEMIDLSAYHGQPGDTIRISVTDDYAVKEVKVVITNSDGSLVEEGYAQPATVGYGSAEAVVKGGWIYAAIVANESTEGDRIEVYASDIPGNIAKAEETL